jgi:DNA topoisomerase-1
MNRQPSSEPRRLVIVESPTKAKTIRRFLPSNRFTIEASMGHVRDLPASAADIPESVKKEGWARLGVNIDNDFEPLYIVTKAQVINQLKRALKNADELYIATDEDREGESIGWHLLEVLKPKIPVKRMVFHEITEEAITEALHNTRDIDRNLVDAQETRRVLDRLVGYTISPLLWKKIAPKLSAGRVQSVAVRLMVLREKDRIAFVPASYWDLKATLEKAHSRFEAQLTHYRNIRVASGRDFDDATGKLKAGLSAGKDVLLLSESDAKALAERLQPQDWQVSNLDERVSSRSPAPPFTTSTLQQEASRKLGLSARDTMRVAQGLYENGYITYMRTDSTNLSQEAIEASRRVIRQRYGSDYLSEKPRQYSTKSRNAQEAHEAIRPAGREMKTREEHRLTGIEGALYDLIWKRTVATQMAEAKLRFVTATITVGTSEEAATFRASGRTILFPGFFRAYVEGSDDPDGALDDREQPLPELREGERLVCQMLEALGHETKPPARFTEASLVKLLEQEGIGRPSTYASIIDTVISRGYARKQGNQLVPTFTAFAVNNLMEARFEHLVDTGFTADMEQTLDDIATGQLKAIPYLKQFYFGDDGLERQVQAGLEAIDARSISTLSFPKWGDYVVRVGRFGPYVEGEIDGERLTSSLPDTLAPGDIDEATLRQFLKEGNTEDKVVGEFPETGEVMLLRRGPYGPYLQLGNDTDGGKPKRVSLPEGLEPREVTADIAKQLLSLPRRLGEHPETGKQVSANIGRFGPYVQHERTFASIPKDENVLTITLERALELIKKKTAKSQAVRTVGNHPETGDPIALFEGRYGPYVKHGRTNASLKEGQSVADLTLDEALALLAEREAKKPSKRKSRKAAPRKTKGASRSNTTKANKTKAKAQRSSKAKAKDLEPFLPELDDEVREVVVRLEGMQGRSAQDMVTITDDLGLSEEAVKKAHKRGMFKLRMAYGKARKEASGAT